MKLSEDRVSHLSHLIHDRLYLDELIEFVDEEAALKVIKKSFATFLNIEDQIDDLVTQKIRSLKRGVLPGTPEWEVLYRKYFEEELRKRKL